jgi:hypothetical protein
MQAATVKHANKDIDTMFHVAANESETKTLRGERVEAALSRLEAVADGFGCPKRVSKL